MKYAFKGFKVSIIGNTAGPLFYKNMWRGETEETKVLTHKEEAHLENIDIEFHGVEVEITGAENLEFIKSIKTVSEIIREELIEWGTLIAAVDSASEPAAEAPAAAATAEPLEAVHVTPVQPNVSAVIGEVLARFKSQLRK